MRMRKTLDKNEESNWKTTLGRIKEDIEQSGQVSVIAKIAETFVQAIIAI